MQWRKYWLYLRRMFLSRTEPDLVTNLGFGICLPFFSSRPSTSISWSPLKSNYSSSQNTLQPVSISLVIKQSEIVVLFAGRLLHIEGIGTICDACRKPPLKQSAVPSHFFLSAARHFYLIYMGFMFMKENQVCFSASPAPFCPIRRSVNLYLLFSATSQVLLLSFLSTHLLHRVREVDLSSATPSLL